MDMQTILDMIAKYEARLVAIGPHDNQRCHGLVLRIFPDGSGSLLAHYCDVKDGDRDDVGLVRTVMTMEDTELFGFDTLAELHGELVAKTMEVK